MGTLALCSYALAYMVQQVFPGGVAGHCTAHSPQILKSRLDKWL